MTGAQESYLKTWPNRRTSRIRPSSIQPRQAPRN
jgi:hypothetical protein